MRFKVGDRVKIICATNGSLGANRKIGIVTDKISTYGLRSNNDGFNVDTGHGKIWRIGFDSVCEKLPNETIVIYRKGSEVIALDKTDGKKAVAKCSPDDEFDFKVGARLAFDRLMGNGKFREVKRHAKVGEYIKIVNEYLSFGWYKNGDILKVTNTTDEDVHCSDKFNIQINHNEYVVLENYQPPKEEPKLMNGKFVCVESDFDLAYTVGKIYEFKDGRTVINNGGSSCSYIDLEDFSIRNCGIKFIELVKDK